jgi:hypothetical protein
VRRRSRCLLPPPMTATLAETAAELMAGGRFPTAGTWHLAVRRRRGFLLSFGIWQCGKVERRIGAVRMRRGGTAGGLRVLARLDVARRGPFA